MTEGAASSDGRAVMPVPESDLRLTGIREQFERAKLFLREARASTDSLDRFRRLMACLYFSRAIVELMLQAAEMEVVKIGRQDLEKWLVEALPRYHLVEALRIHDFHRFGLLQRPGMFMAGPVKFRARSGAAALYMTNDGPRRLETGDSRVIEQRALHFLDGRVCDENAQTYVSFETVLDDYLKGVPRAIEEFRSL